jgi:hypothetical protein
MSSFVYSMILESTRLVTRDWRCLPIQVYSRTCTGHTKPPSQMQYGHYLYLYRLSTRLKKRNVSIMLETIVNAAEVTSALLLNRHFDPCSVTTSGPMVLSTRTQNIMFCLYEPLLQITKDRMSLSCLHMMIIDVMLPYLYFTVFTISELQRHLVNIFVAFLNVHDNSKFS